MSDDKIILYDSDEAAKFGKFEIEGWWSRDGRYFGNNEHLARYAGATHKKCDCGDIMRIHSSWCDECSKANAKARYKDRSVVQWDGECLIYSEALDEYFSDWELAAEAAWEHDMDPDDMMFRDTRRSKLSDIDSDRWMDELSEDDDSTLEDLEDLVRDFNDKLENIKTNSWYPGSHALLIPEGVHRYVQ